MQAALIVLLRTWGRGKGRIYPEWAIRLQRNGADWAAVPDLGYISYEQLPKSWKKNDTCPVPPELVIEILSPKQTVEEFEEKAYDYFQAGVSRMWLIDPAQQTISVFSPQRPAKVYQDDIPITDELLPELGLSPREIFEEADIL
ncbi:Uma2 family endonuclease [Anthocerotibacter panamensis]|uniref:Uma2 family endonuclease n=1 Tax=Anthocerotibacter panamensis TaxID=2857077 RepID=UPI001C4052C2|nr:Uma2 family endonuclease [Anthocerotibacter panamensis]